jgi:hypothetical protein
LVANENLKNRLWSRAAQALAPRVEYWNLLEASLPFVPFYQHNIFGKTQKPFFFKMIVLI